MEEGFPGVDEDCNEFLFSFILFCFFIVARALRAGKQPGSIQTYTLNDIYV